MSPAPLDLYLDHLHSSPHSLRRAPTKSQPTPPPPSPILPILGNPSLSCDAPLVEQVNCSFHRGELLFRLQPAFSDGVEECDNIHHHGRENFRSSPHCQAAAMRYCDYISSVMDTTYVEAIKRFRLTPPPPPPQCGIISSAVAWRGVERKRIAISMIFFSYLMILPFLPQVSTTSYT